VERNDGALSYRENNVQEEGSMTHQNMKKYGLYLLRWQLSTPILAGALYVLTFLDTLSATIVANLLGGLIFFWVDRYIFASNQLKGQLKMKSSIVNADCAREMRARNDSKTEACSRITDGHPNFSAKSAQRAERGYCSSRV
jgi:hypothetical protein